MIDGQCCFTFSFAYSDEFGGHPTSYSVLFSGSINEEFLDIADTISRFAEETASLPDYFIVLVPESQYSSFSIRVKDKRSEFHIAIDRLAVCDAVYLAGYDRNGDIASASGILGRAGTARQKIKTILPTIRSSGLLQIVKNYNVLTKAPPGFLFAKFSSKKSNYFIRAENALEETSCTLFIAFCILPFLSRRSGREYQVLPDVLYIDTMGISSLAYTLANLLSSIGGCLYQPRIVSFHSYAGLHGDNFRHRRNSFCLISASTSCSLAEQWAKENGCSTRDVLTLFSFMNHTDEHQVLCTIDTPDDYESFSEEDNSSGKKSIRVYGEHFLNKYTPPKPVTITKKHAPSTLPQSIEQFTGEKLFRCNKSKRGLQDSWSIGVDLEALLGLGALEEWLFHELSFSAPSSVGAIVYQQDEFSKRLAFKAYQHLSLRLKDLNEPIAQAEVLRNKNAIGGKGIIVIAASVGATGRQILKLNRDLRNVHSAMPRLYLIGAMLSENVAQQHRLRSNLTQPPRDQPTYSWRVFLESTVGPALKRNSWQREMSLLSRLTERPGKRAFRTRLDRLRSSGKGLCADAFWPSDSGNAKQALRLRKGFAFASSSLVVERVSASDMYFIVASILQNARETSSVGEEFRLSSQEFQHVVLHPENFRRFDDGIVQAAILRAALDSELDYRDSQELSDSMAEIVAEIVENVGTDAGEAATEFLVAVCTKRLQLRPQSKKFLIEIADQHGKPAHIRSLAKYAKTQC